MRSPPPPAPLPPRRARARRPAPLHIGVPPAHPEVSASGERVPQRADAAVLSRSDSRHEAGTVIRIDVARIDVAPVRHQIGKPVCAAVDCGEGGKVARRG